MSRELESTPAELDRLEVMGRAALKELGFDDRVARLLQQRFVEGLSATRVKEFQYQGVVVVGEERPDHEVRHKYVELGFKTYDWLPSKIEHEVHGDVGITIIGLDPDKV